MFQFMAMDFHIKSYGNEYASIDTLIFVDFLGTTYLVIDLLNFGSTTVYLPQCVKLFSGQIKTRRL